MSVPSLQKVETAAQRPAQQANPQQLLMQLRQQALPTPALHSLKTEALGFVFQR